MNEIIENNRVHTEKNYYQNFIVKTSILLVVIIIIQIPRPPSIYGSLIMFLLFESYFLFRRQVSNISIQDDIIFIEYFVCLKKINFLQKY